MTSFSFQPAVPPVVNNKKQANLAAFKAGDVRFLICTDVAARGVDIKGLPYVVNMTLPDVPENYIHRIGRVGRQDCLGLAVSIVASDGCKEKARLLLTFFCRCLHEFKNVATSTRCLRVPH